jgi:3'-5' exoribonuclease
VSAIAQLAEERIVEGIYAVARKQRLRTRNGVAYLALELVDPSGRIEARVWNDVDLLDGRFAEGDAVRVLGRVDKFRDRLQLEVRSLAGEIVHPGLKATVSRFLAEDALRASLRSLPAAPNVHHSYAGGLLEHTVGVATICREAAQLHPRLRTDLLLAAALLHDVGRARELGPGPSFRQTDEGRLLGHVHLGLRLIEQHAGELDPEARTEVLHAVASHHDARAARTAEAAVLYHANQLDAVAATRPVTET